MMYIIGGVVLLLLVGRFGWISAENYGKPGDAEMELMQAPASGLPAFTYECANKAETYHEVFSLWTDLKQRIEAGKRQNMEMTNQRANIEVNMEVGNQSDLRAQLAWKLRVFFFMEPRCPECQLEALTAAHSAQEEEC